MDCPWCAKSVDFTCQEIFEWRPYSDADTGFLKNLDDMRHVRENRLVPDRGPFFQRKGAHDVLRAYGFGTCPKCSCPVILLFKSSLRDLYMLRHAEPNSPMARSVFAAQHMTLENTVPERPATKVPASAPHKVKELWPHTLAALERGDPPSRIVSECRSILDVSLKELGTVTGTRRERIAKLKANHILTEDLANWGEILWKDGNDAVHDIDADLNEARQHVEFLKLFFQVAFELNEQIKARRSREQES